MIVRGNDVWVNWQGTAVKRTSFVDGTQNEGVNESVKILDGESFPLEELASISVIADSATQAQLYCVILISDNQIPSAGLA